MARQQPGHKLNRKSLVNYEESCCKTPEKQGTLENSHQGSLDQRN